MWSQKPSFRFTIDNFSQKKAPISSPAFVSGGCKWFLYISPKGDSVSDSHLPLYLYLANSSKLRTGWKRSIDFYFVLLNQSNKELHTSSISKSSVFCAKNKGRGLWTLPVSKFQEKEFLEKDRLIIEVYINVIEAFDEEGGGDVSNKQKKKKKKTVDINGFQVFDSQVTKVGKMFIEHPDIALDFKPTNQEVKTAYMNVLLRVIKTLNKPPKSLSETRLSKASSELSELISVGFKLDWLKSKLEEVSLERKKPDADGSRVQQLEELIRHLEVKVDEVSLGRKKSDDDNESRAQQVEERVKNLEMLELGLKLDSLNTKLGMVSLERKKSEERVKNLELTYLDLFLKPKLDESRVQQLEELVKHLELKLDEVSLERKKSDDINESRAQQVEERVKYLELKDSLNTKLVQVALEKKKADDSNESRAQQVEKRVKNLELMEVGLKLDSLNTKLDEVSLEKKKADDTNESRAQQVEKRVKNLELMGLGMGVNTLGHLKSKLDDLERKKSYESIALEVRVKEMGENVMVQGFNLEHLNTRLEEMSKERKKTDDADRSLVQESVKKIQLMVSHLTLEVDKKKNKSSDDGFLLID